MSRFLRLAPRLERPGAVRAASLRRVVATPVAPAMAVAGLSGITAPSSFLVQRAQRRPGADEATRTFTRAVALATLAMAALATPRRAAAQATVDATHYTVHLTSVETDAKGRRTAAPPLVGHVQVAGAPVSGSPIVTAPVRVDIVAGREGFATGDYLLTDPDGVRVLVVSPARRSYRELSAADLARQGGRRVRITVDEPRVWVDTLAPEPADVPGAVPTRRVRVERAFALHVKVLFVSQRARITEQTDYWVSDAVRDLPVPVLWLFTEMSRAVSAGDADLARRTQEAERGVRRGVVRSRTVVVQEGEDGRQASEAETRIADLRRAPVDAARFVLPTGFRRSDR
jgi:hypothetical protein